jgi:hypothetical protein
LSEVDTQLDAVKSKTGILVAITEVQKVIFFSLDLGEIPGVQAAPATGH